MPESEDRQVEITEQDRQLSVALCSAESAKLCALFFDRIRITDNWVEQGDFPSDIGLSKGLLINVEVQAVANLIVASLCEGEEKLRLLGLTQERQQWVRDNIVDVAFDDFKSLVERIAFTEHMLQIARAHGLSFTPFFHDTKSFLGFLPPGGSDNFEIRLEDIGVVDASNLEWDSISEIRRDKESIHKLRRFRLFMTDNYKGKSSSFIRDDLLLRIHDYEEACKKHGLELKQSVIAKLLNSKSLLGSLGLSTASILFGQPFMAGASILTGTCLELGKIAIHLSQKQLEFESWQNKAEIAYLMDIRGKIEQKE